jgi:hypothetical protein
MSRTTYAVLLGLPGLVLAAIGTTHPNTLTASSAEHWWVMHTVLIPLFPLIGVSLWWIVRLRRDLVSWTALVLAATFMAGYCALDILAGIGAGYITQRTGDVDDAWSGPLFEIGNDLGDIGAWAFLALALLVGVSVTMEVIRRARPASDRMAAVAGAVVLAAAGWSFLHSHIYRWDGVATVFAIGLGTGLLAWSSYLKPAQVDQTTVSADHGGHASDTA